MEKKESVRIIGLDETGKFEYNNNNSFTCIGGLFADVSASEDEKEIKEISDYYDRLCLEFNKKKNYEKLKEGEESKKDDKKKIFDEDGNVICYKPDNINDQVKKGLEKGWKVFFPESFHGFETVIYNGLRDDKNRLIDNNNRYDKRNTEVEINKGSEDEKLYNSFIYEFNNYIRNNTAYYVKGKKYKMWCYIYPYTKDNSEKKSNIVDLDKADNLYEEMAITSVENLSFYVMDSDIKKVFLNAATKINKKGNDDTNKEQYNDLYSKKTQNFSKKSNKADEGEEKDIYYITDTSFYKTALRHRYNSLNDNHIDFKMNVAKIEYKGNKDAYTKSNNKNNERSSEKSNGSFAAKLENMKSQVSKDNDDNDDSKDQEEDNTITPAEQWKKTKEEQGFHYASDIICGYFSNIFYNKDYVENAFELKNSDDGEIYDIRFFSEEDMIYRKMLDCVRVNDITGYYSLKYDFRKRLSGKYINSVSERHNPKKTNVKAIGENLCDYYEEFFVRKIDEYIKNRIINSRDYGNKLIGSMQEYWSYTDGLMGRRENEYERGMYIAKNIYDNIIIPLDSNNRFRSTQYKKMFIFRFNDIILRGYNHRGDVSKALKHNKICMENIAAIGMDELQEFKQRSFQIYFNSMDYNKIIEEYKTLYKLKEVENGIILDRVEEIEELMKNMSGISGTKSVLMGKIYSTLGQAYAFLNNSLAIDCYRRALEEMEGEKGNLDVTYTFLVHYYISNGDRNNAEKYFKKYLDKKDDYIFTSEEVKEWFDSFYGYIEKDLNSEYRFALYLLLKSIRFFYMDTAKSIYKQDDKEASMLFAEYMAEKLLRLKDKNEALDNENKELSGDYIHPYQLIYKNMFDILEIIRQDYLKESDYDAMDEEKKKKYNKCEEYEKQLAMRILDKKRFENGLTIQAIIIKFKLCLPMDIMKTYMEDLDLSERFIEAVEAQKYADALSDAEKIILKDMYGLSALGTSSITQFEVMDMLEKKLTYMYD